MPDRQNGGRQRPPLSRSRLAPGMVARTVARCEKVLWCCEEMAVEYERIDAGGAFGIVNTPEYRRLNPNGLVPTIDDDGFVLWESHAIVRYLAAKHSAGFWPEERRTRAEADQWMLEPDDVLARHPSPVHGPDPDGAGTA